MNLYDTVARLAAHKIHHHIAFPGNEGSDMWTITIESTGLTNNKLAVVVACGAHQAPDHTLMILGRGY